jgi:transcription antitermination factor NusG
MGLSAKIDFENHLSDQDSRWFAVRTRYKDEKMAFKQLQLNGISAYLPIKKLARRYGRKLRHVELPLINSFVFVKIFKNQYHLVLQTQYTTGFLKFGNNLLSIPENEIQLIKRLLHEDIDLEVVPISLEKGDIVEVVTGPLLGLRGRLLHSQGKGKMLVDLNNFGHALQITIDNQLLRKISEPA